MSNSCLCPPSPTSAHHWLIDKFGLGQCKYCSEVKHFTSDFHMSRDYASVNAKVKATQNHTNIIWRERRKKKQVNADLDYALAEALRETTE